MKPTNQQTGQAGELIAVKLAERLGWQPWRTNVPIAGGEADVVCLRTRDGKREARVRNGHPLMGRVTGTGCAASAVTGAFVAVEPDPFHATVAALVVFGLAGEWAAQRAQRPGSYGIALIDGLDAVTP